MSNRAFAITPIVFATGLLFALLAPQARADDTLRETADAIDAAMWKHVAPQFEQHIDRRHGGFRESVDKEAPDVRSIVHQSRMLWTAAEVARRRPDHAEQYKAYARHALDFLSNTMWDEQRGGFYFKRLSNGKHHESLLEEKHVYGSAFAVYAAANAARVLDDPEPALDLAQRGYRWIEGHARDHEHGGYFEAFTLAGEPILQRPAGQRRRLDSIGTAYGFKSMNSHIHLLEAYTTLYRVWPDPQLGERLEALLTRVVDVIHVEPGTLNMFFTRDWRAVPNGASFGHDVETAFLMTEAAEALGGDWPRRVQPIAQRIVDHAMEWGYDSEFGGLYNDGRTFRPPYSKEKMWWVQAEAMNAFALMHARHGEQDGKYAEAMMQTWAFIHEHVIDAPTGRWRSHVERDGTPLASRPDPPAVQDIYHTGRAMLETADRLRALSQQ